MSTRRIAAALIVVAALASATPAAGQSLGVYDSFTSAELDARRWRGYEYLIGGTDARNRALLGGDSDGGDYTGASLFGPDSINEGRRRVVGGQAQIAQTSSNRGGLSGDYSHGKARAGLRMNHPALADHSPLVTTLRASVTVAGVAVEPPDDGEGCWWQNSARAQVFGHFFNDGTSTGPGDQTGDVFALVSLERRVEGSVARNVVEAQVGRCGSAGCRVSSTSVLFTRSWTVGAAHVVTINWRPAMNAFKFTVSGGGLPAESRTMSYTMADSAPPRGYAYDLRVETQPGVCFVDDQTVWQTVSIDARFDDVLLNSAAAAAAP